MSSVDRVLPVLKPALAALDLLAEDVALTPAGKRSVLRVAVDRDLHRLDPADDTARVPPLTLDEVAEATTAVSSALDASDVMGPRPYVLEVSSTGVDRPLTLPRHFRRNVGRLLTVSMADGSLVSGRVQAAGPQTITLAVSGEGGTGDGHVDGSGSRGRERMPSERTVLRQLALRDVALARVQVEFTHAAEQERDAADADEWEG